MPLAVQASGFYGNSLFYFRFACYMHFYGGLATFSSRADVSSETELILFIANVCYLET